MSSRPPLRDDAITRATNYLDSGDFEADLARRVAIPTESQTPDGLPHCARYLDDEMAPAFEAMSFETQIFPNPIAGCGPVLLATRFEADAREVAPLLKQAGFWLAPSIGT